MTDAADEAVYKILINAPIKKVWVELVKTDVVLPFFFGSVCKTTVEFSLITTNVPADTKTEKSMAQGGKFIIETFKSVVETGRPSFGGRLMLGMMALFTPFTPKVCRSENWTFETIDTL